MPLFVVTIFLSAFLLFQVQPIVARYILPWYGGSPAVWTTCMLFFQVGLLLGYGYAHLLATFFRHHPRRQFWIHLGVVALALVFLPITPDASLRPSGEQDASNVWSIVKLLSLTVGLPYIAISASGPLLQHWYAGVTGGKSPYRLYAVSNLGSLLGLLSYPFLFEPALGLKHQTWWWSAGFLFYGALALLCAYRHREVKIEEAETGSGDEPQAPPSWRRVLLWILFAACGSSLMLAITNQMCQDVAVVPFLWVLPLALYLTTFIIAFDRSAWYVRLVWIPLAAVATGLMVHLLNQQFADGEMHLYRQIAIYLAALFTLCMVCHGEMVRLKPDHRHLTAFYLFVSLGGAVGGAFVSLIAPRLFTGYWELHLLLLLVTLLVGLLISFQLWKTRESPILAGAGLAVTAAAFVALGIGLRAHFRETRADAIASARSFHGVIRVYEGLQDTSDHYRAMYHGRISHGRQYLSDEFRNIPTTYYGEDSGVGALMQSLPQRRGANKEPVRLGVIGLGSGSIAVHAKPGDEMIFYEINPQVEALARSHFTYLADCQGEVSVVLGDARTSLENELARSGPRNFDVLFVDAFSGDSIPVHLITKEAFEIYFRHIKEGGSLVVHITNLHIDLSDPVRQLARKFDREALLVEYNPNDHNEVYHLFFSEWVIITRNEEVIRNLYRGDWVLDWRREEPKEIHWTDDYSNLFQVIMHD